MKLEASHFDTVNWNPTLILPGTIVNRLKRIGRSKIGAKKKIIVKAPCKLDIGLIDHSGIKFTDAGGYKPGEMSFACARYTTVSVSLTERPEINIKSKRPLLVKHNALLIKNSTDYRGGFEIETESDLEPHSGFGSSAVMADLVLYGINELLGRPLSFRELKYIASYNYAEESDTDPNKMFPGASSGATFNTINRGGFVMTSSECEQIFRSEIPEEMTFVIGTPRMPLSGPELNKAEMGSIGWMRHIERIAAAQTCQWIVMEIMPYWVKGDYARVGQAIYNYTIFSAKSIHLLLYKCNAHDVLFELKDAGLEAGWMCSAGPSLGTYTLSQEKIQLALDIFKKHNWDSLVVKGDNKGIHKVDRL